MTLADFGYCSFREPIAMGWKEKVIVLNNPHSLISNIMAFEAELGVEWIPAHLTIW